jgi:hypothetical protein
MTDWRTLCTELTNKLQGYASANPHHDSDALVARARAALAQPEPAGVGPTDEELMEIRDAAYCPGADEVNDEEDLMWQYTSDYIDRLYEHGSVQEQQEYEAKGLRAVFDAGARWGRPAPPPALQPVPADTRYEFSVMNGDYVEQACGSAPTLNQARDEGLRYLAQYSQDGPHTLELRRVEVLPATALPLPAGEVQE